MSITMSCTTIKSAPAGHILKWRTSFVVYSTDAPAPAVPLTSTCFSAASALAGKCSVTIGTMSHGICKRRRHLRNRLPGRGRYFSSLCRSLLRDEDSPGFSTQRTPRSHQVDFGCAVCSLRGCVTAHPRGRGSIGIEDFSVHLVAEARPRCPEPVQQACNGAIAGISCNAAREIWPVRAYWRGLDLRPIRTDTRENTLLTWPIEIALWRASQAESDGRTKNPKGDAPQPPRLRAKGRTCNTRQQGTACNKNGVQHRAIARVHCLVRRQPTFAPRGHALEHRQSRRAVPGGSLVSTSLAGAHSFFTSAPSVFAALFPPSVATHDTKSEPQQGPEDGDDDGIEPQRPGEVPDQEVKSDLLGVLDDEYQEQSNSDERCNRPTTESGVVLAAGTRIQVGHDDPLAHIDHRAKRPTCVPSMSHGGIRHAHPFRIPR